MVKLPKTYPKSITSRSQNFSPKKSVLALSHEVCKIRCFTSKTKFGARHWWLCLKSRTKTYRFWVRAHVLIMHGMSSLIYSLSLMSIGQRRTPYPINSRVRLWASGFSAFKFYINSKSLRLNLKKYLLGLIPNSASFYNFVFDIQCHLSPQLAYFIGIGCLHLTREALFPY